MDGGICPGKLQKGFPQLCDAPLQFICLSTDPHAGFMQADSYKAERGRGERIIQVHAAESPGVSIERERRQQEGLH